MTKKELEAVGKRLLKYLPPQYACKGGLIFATPIGSVLRGIFLERSGWDPEAFYVRVFAQPTYVASEHVGLNLGTRLGGGAHAWRTELGNWEEQLSAAIVQEALPLLASIKGPLDLADAAVKLRVTGDGTVKRFIAYSHARAGHVAAAVELLQQSEDTTNRSIKWQVDQAAEDRTLRELLAEDPAKAQAILQANEESTVANLKLERYYRDSVCDP
jgi:hypothetical protein